MLARCLRQPVRSLMSGSGESFVDVAARGAWLVGGRAGSAIGATAVPSTDRGRVRPWAWGRERRDRGRGDRGPRPALGPAPDGPSAAGKRRGRRGGEVLTPRS